MKNKSILILLGVAILTGSGIFALTACDQKNSAPSVENSEVREINVSDDLRDFGLRIDRVLLANGKTTATIYARYEKSFSATVILEAFDRTGNEIGRAKRTLSGNVDDAGYTDFDFDSRVPMKSASYFRLIRATATPNVPATVQTDVPAEQSEGNATTPAPEEASIAEDTETAVPPPTEQQPESK